jgi:hypothetical protein
MSRAHDGNVASTKILRNNLDLVTEQTEVLADLIRRHTARRTDPAELTSTVNSRQRHPLSGPAEIQSAVDSTSAQLA